MIIRELEPDESAAFGAIHRMLSLVAPQASERLVRSRKPAGNRCRAACARAMNLRPAEGAARSNRTGCEHAESITGGDAKHLVGGAAAVALKPNAVRKSLQ